MPKMCQSLLVAHLLRKNSRANLNLRVDQAGMMSQHANFKNNNKNKPVRKAKAQPANIKIMKIPSIQSKPI